MKKNVSVFGCQLLVTVGLAGFDIDEQTDKIMKLLPEDSNGPEVTDENVRMSLVRVLDFAKVEAESLLEGVTTPVDIPDEPEPIEPEKPEYNSHETHSLTSFAGNNKTFCWLPRTGSHYGKNFKFVFPKTGEEWIINDGAVTQGRDGNPRNYNQMFFFCGTDFKRGQAEWNNGLASVFSSPNSGCPVVEIYYNR